MSQILGKSYTFDDLSLVPVYNNVPSRTIPTLKTKLTKNIELDVPFLAANMDTVISPDCGLCDILLENGSMPLMHRFMPFEKQYNFVRKYENRCFISSGFKELDNTVKLLEAGSLGVVVDVAHGHCETMKNYVQELRRVLKTKDIEKEIIVGNCSTADAVIDMFNWGADAVKVGQGPGSQCSTRQVTGIGIGQLSAIMETSRAGKRLGIPIIADGGIRNFSPYNASDIVKALAAGASTVMMGSLFAKCYESAAPKVDKVVNVDGEEVLVKYARIRGQSSKDFIDDFYGEGKKKNIVPEGIVSLTKCTGPTQMFIDNMSAGIRSAMTYLGSKTIEEMQTKAKFVEVVSVSYDKESNPRPHQ